MTFFKGIGRALTSPSDGDESTLTFGFRGEDVEYREGGRELVISFTYVDGARVYADSIDQWKDGSRLTDAEKERVLVKVLQFVRRGADKPIVVINTDESSRALWERLCETHRSMISGVELTSDEGQLQLERGTYLRLLRAGRLVIDGIEIVDERALNEHFTERRRKRSPRPGR